MSFRRAAAVDANQPEIVKQLRKLGYSVLITSQLKKCFDILVGANGINYAIEIKDENKPPSHRKLTVEEKKFFDNWKGQVNCCKNIDEILDIIK